MISNEINCLDAIFFKILNMQDQMCIFYDLKFLQLLFQQNRFFSNLQSSIEQGLKSLLWLNISISHISVSNKAFGTSTWVNDKRHTWKEWRYGHSSLAVDGKTDTTLPNCAIMDNYYVESPVWMADLGKETTVNGVVAITWQGAGQGKEQSQLDPDHKCVVIETTGVQAFW